MSSCSITYWENLNLWFRNFLFFLLVLSIVALYFKNMLLCVLLSGLFVPFTLIDCRTWRCSVLLALESALSGDLPALLFSVCFTCKLRCYIQVCFLRACLEVLAGERILVYAWRESGPPLLGMVILFGRVSSFRRDTHGAVREGGDMHLPSQISWVNPAVTGVAAAATRSPSRPRKLWPQARGLSFSWIV